MKTNREIEDKLLIAAKRLSNGSVRGAAALTEASQMSMRTRDINFLQDGDIFEVPQNSEYFVIQNIRGNKAPVFVVSTERGVVPVYMSQFAKSVQLCDEIGNTLKDENGNVKWAKAGGTVYDTYITGTNPADCFNKLREYAKENKKRIKVSLTQVMGLRPTGNGNEMKPARQNIYSFDWVD